MSIILWTNWREETYAFCSDEHARMFHQSLTDSAALQRDPESGIPFGYWWFGQDLSKGTKWL